MLSGANCAGIPGKKTSSATARRTPCSPANSGNPTNRGLNHVYETRDPEHSAPAAWPRHSSKARKKKKPEGAPAVGYDDTPFLPDQKWRVHDIERPHPRMVAPGAEARRPALRRHRALQRQGSFEVVTTPPKGKSGGHMRARLEGRERLHGGRARRRDACSRRRSSATASSTSSGPRRRRSRRQPVARQQRRDIMGRYEIQVLDSYEQPDLRRRPGGGDLRPVAAAGERRRASPANGRPTTSSSRRRALKARSW